MSRDATCATEAMRNALRNFGRTRMAVAMIILAGCLRRSPPPPPPTTPAPVSQPQIQQCNGVPSSANPIHRMAVAAIPDGRRVYYGSGFGVGTLSYIQRVGDTWSAPQSVGDGIGTICVLPVGRDDHLLVYWQNNAWRQIDLLGHRKWIADASVLVPTAHFERRSDGRIDMFFSDWTALQRLTYDPTEETWTGPVALVSGRYAVDATARSRDGRIQVLYRDTTSRLYRIEETQGQRLTTGRPQAATGFGAPTAMQRWCTQSIATWSDRLDSSRSTCLSNDENAARNDSTTSSRSDVRRHPVFSLRMSQIACHRDPRVTYFIRRQRFGRCRPAETKNSSVSSRSVNANVGLE